jgi:hypothetical protein
LLELMLQQLLQQLLMLSAVLQLHVLLLCSPGVLLHLRLSATLPILGLLLVDVGTGSSISC